MAASATTPSSVTAARQELLSSTRPGTSRPVMPPSVLPATYTPIAVPSSAGCTSSPRWATATATTAASEIPTSPRASSSSQKYGAAAAAKVKTQASSSPARITGTRPSDSATEDSGSIPSAIAPVAAETVRLAAVGPTPKSAPIAGSSAWVE